MAIDSGELNRPTFGIDLGLEEPDPKVDGISSAILDHILQRGERPKVVILIPAYNEELTIGSVVLQAKKYAHHVLVVNDGSKDKTSEIARAAGAEVIDHLKNSGKAAALSTGFRELRKRDFDIIVTMDGDGQHKIEDINTLLIPLLDEEADLVIGSRFLNKGVNIPLYRQIGQKILNKVTNVGSPKKVTDSQSGFRALNRKALRHMDFHSMGYAVEQDMILHCLENGLRITDVPISVRYDVPNGHKQGSFRMGMSLLNNLISTIGYKRPLLLFGLPGIALVGTGSVIGILSILEHYFMGSWLLQGLMAGFMVIVGSTLTVSALSLNSLSQLMRMNKLTR